VGKGGENTDNSLKSLGYIAHCRDCMNRMVIKGLAPVISDKCPICGGDITIGGPLWCGDMYDPEFVSSMIDTFIKLELNTEPAAIKLLETCLSESKAPISHYEIHKVCKNLKIGAPPLQKIMDRLKDGDYFVSRTHFSPTSIKTDAGIIELKRIILNLKSDQM
jgi:tRNA (guanine26-N2/guanine27-N2)-dimethyltransferase